MMDPQQRAVAEEFDKYRNKYSDTVNDALIFSGLKVDFFTHVKADYIKDIIATEFDEPGDLRVLDVGCGVGNFHPLLRGSFGELVGVDVSSECVEEAGRRNDGVRYDVYTGEQLPYEQGSFDVVFTICVMHHVPPAQWPGFVADMYRVLRPGGLALIFEHNPYNPLTRYVVNRCPFDEDAVLLKAGKIRLLMEKSGFSSIKSRSILSIPAGTTFLRRVDRLFSRLPLGAQYFACGKKTTLGPNS